MWSKSKSRKIAQFRTLNNTLKMFKIIQNYLIYYLKKNIICNLSFGGLIEYLSKNRGRNCLEKWSTHKLSFLPMSRKWINVMILIILF